MIQSIRTIVPVFVVALCLAVPAWAQSRVSGSDLFEGDETSRIEKTIGPIMKYDLTQEEVTLFFEELEGIVAWVEENREEWVGINRSEEPISALKNLGLWETVGITATEYIALILKLQTVVAIVSKEIELDALEKQLASLEEMRPIVPPEQKGELEEAVEVLTSMIEGLEAYPEGNLEVYRDHRDKIDPALKTLEHE